MNEWFMIVITAIYALITFFIWRANKKSVDEMKLSRELAYRPEVIAFFYEKQGGLYFQIKNIGSRAAFDTTVMINPSFNIHTHIGDKNFMEVDYDKTKGSYYKKKIKLLAPNQYLETFVGIQDEIIKGHNKSSENVIENKEDLEGIIELNYYNYGKEAEYKENYDVTLSDYQSHKGIRINGVHEGVNALNKINENLSEINTALKK